MAAMYIRMYIQPCYLALSYELSIDMFSYINIYKYICKYKYIYIYIYLNTYIFIYIYIKQHVKRQFITQCKVAGLNVFQEYFKYMHKLQKKMGTKSTTQINVILQIITQSNNK